jgi:hypothetical protein
MFCGALCCFVARCVVLWRVELFFGALSASRHMTRRPQLAACIDAIIAPTRSPVKQHS